MAMKQLREELKKFNPRRSLLAVVIVIAASWILSCTIPAGSEYFGALSLIPALFLIVYIFATKRILEALMLASIVGFMMTAKGAMESNAFVENLHTPLDVLGLLSGTLTEVVMSEDIAWLFIVCGLMGSIISLIEKAGGAFAFGEWVAKRAKTRKSVLLWTWVLGIVIFIDDYLNSLTVGSCMAPVTDKKRVPREFLAYIVDSTAAPLCVLIPISTWAVFCGKLLETNGWAPDGDGLLYFIKTIPFSYYGWVAALIVPFVIIGVIPTFGPMKKAEQRVKDGGPLAPPDSDKIDIKGGIAEEKPANPKIINFLLPIVVLVAATVIADLDMQVGVLVTMLFMFIFYLAQKVITADEFADVTVTGIKNMILPLLLMVLAFLFAEVNSQIGFTAYVIEGSTNIMTPALMPLIIFLVLACTEFITGTNWGMYIIALPIVIPLATNLGVNMPLAVSAVLSAGVFGSHVCFYSDATILTSAATGCNNFRHAITQAPFGLLAAGISAILYLVMGFVFAP
jgi:Na+/H+ antiporter NhaC